MGMPIANDGEIEAENLNLACRNAVLNMIALLHTSSAASPWTSAFPTSSMSPIKWSQHCYRRRFLTAIENAAVSDANGIGFDSIRVDSTPYNASCHDREGLIPVPLPTLYNPAR